MSKKLLYIDTEFTEHPVYKGYFISKCGQVIGTKVKIVTQHNEKGYLISNQRIPYSGIMLLKAAKRRKDMDYLFVVIHHNGKRINKWVHSLVLETFVGERPLKGVCRHLDNNASNNHLNNLKWGTQKENMADKYKHGTEQTGSRGSQVKLNILQVRAIRLLKKTNWQYSKITKHLSQKWGVSESCIGSVYYNKNWNTLT